MASRFELLDVGALDYDIRLGLPGDDAGAGPPIATDAYAGPGAIGWVRTGGPSQFHDTGETPGTATTNCATWSSASAEAYGTVAFLGGRFTTAGDAPAAVWSGGSRRCDRSFHVWCVEDRPHRERGEYEGRHRRRGDDDDSD